MHTVLTECLLSLKIKKSYLNDFWFYEPACLYNMAVRALYFMFRHQFDLQTWCCWYWKDSFTAVPLLRTYNVELYWIVGETLWSKVIFTRFYLAQTIRVLAAEVNWNCMPSVIRAMSAYTSKSFCQQCGFNCYNYANAHSHVKKLKARSSYHFHYYMYSMSQNLDYAVT